jgi:hypothetical protein
MKYEWIKQGQNYIRVPIVVNIWTCDPPIEDEIKKPTLTSRLFHI